MKKSLIAVTVLLVSLAAGGTAFAKHFGPGGGKFARCGQSALNEEQHAEKVAKRLAKMDLLLDLSDQQKAELTDLFNRHWQDRQAVRDERRSEREMFRNELQTGQLDEAAIRAKVAERAEHRADRIVERLALKEQVNAILTPEQQQKAEQFRGNRGLRGHRSGAGQGVCL